MESRKEKQVLFESESYLSQVWKNNELPSVSRHSWAKADLPLHNPTSDLLFEKQMVQFYRKYTKHTTEMKAQEYFKWKIIRFKHNFKRLTYFSKLRFNNNARKRLYIWGNNYSPPWTLLSNGVLVLTQYYCFRTMPELFQKGNSHYHAVSYCMAGALLTEFHVSNSLCKDVFFICVLLDNIYL